jgi:hypothetical protein
MNIAYQNRAACPPRSGFFPTFWSATSVSIRSLGSGSRRSKAPESQPFASESRASDRRPACRATAYGRRQGRFFGGRGRAIGTKSLIWPRHAPGCQIADILTESVTGAGNLTCDDVHSKAIAASSASRICRRRKATRCGGSRAELQSVCPTSSFGRGEDRKDVGKGMLAQARWDDTTKDAKLPDQINKMLDCSDPLTSGYSVRTASPAIPPGTARRHTYFGIDSLSSSSSDAGQIPRELVQGSASAALKPFPIEPDAICALERAAQTYIAVLGSSLIVSSSRRTSERHACRASAGDCRRTPSANLTCWLSACRARTRSGRAMRRAPVRVS